MLCWTPAYWARVVCALCSSLIRSVLTSITTPRAKLCAGFAATAVAALMLGGCGGGGGGGGGSGGGSAALLVSGTVSAPSGQVAFDTRRDYLTQLASLIISRADAALTGISPVADGTIVDLVRIDSLGNGLTTLATTKTAGGKYSFDLTKLGLSPASDLAVQVVNTATLARMRAFVTGDSVNLDPVSETVLRMVLEKLAATPGSTLTNLTVEELNDFAAASGIVAELSNAGAGVNIESAVGAIKTKLSTDTKLATFLGDAVNAGQSSVVLGDMGNYYPIVQGKPMVYDGTISFNGGSPSLLASLKFSFTGTKTVNGVQVSVLTTSDQFNPVVGEDYFVKTDRALVFHGDNDFFDPLTAALVPYDEMRFPLRPGSSYEQSRKNNLDSGQDLDEDGTNERVNIVSTVSVSKADGPVTVPSGIYTDVLKVVAQITLTFKSSAFGDTTVINVTDSKWLAPGVGPIKLEIEITTPEDGQTQIETWALTPKQNVGPEPPLVARVEVSPTSFALAVGGTQLLSATAYDPNGIPISGFPISWTSSNENVIAIEGPGQFEGTRIVRGAGIGAATLTASLGGVSSPPLTVTIAEVRILHLATNDIVYDPGTAKIYASVPGRAGSIGNSIIPIDPETGIVGNAVGVGSEPNKLARSDDGQYLYFGLDGANAVRRFSISTQTAGLQFQLGIHPQFGPMVVDDIKALPGAPDSVAVLSRYVGYSIGSGGVAIYDGDTKRPNETPGFFELGPTISLIEFSAISSRLYGVDTITTGAGFTRMNINSTGVSVADETRNLLFGRDVEFDSGLFFSSGGAVLDPERITLIGSFPLSTTYAAESVRVESARNRAYFLESGYTGWEIEAFNVQTFTPVGSIRIPGIPNVYPQCGNLIRWGANGLAFRCADSISNDPQDYLVLIRTNLVP